MSTGERQKIFAAYCYPEKKWMDRVQAAAAAAGVGNLISWDERKLRFGHTWRAELDQALGTSKVAILLVSEMFLESDFITRAKLPALLTAARAQGLDVRWILVGHCAFESAGLDEALALNHLDLPLDALSTARREAVLAEIAQRLKAIAHGRPEPVPIDHGSDPLCDEAEISPYVKPLGAVVDARRRTIALLKGVRRLLLPLALLLMAAAVPIGLLRGNLALAASIGAYGLFTAGIAVVLRKQFEWLGQSVIGIRCVRTGLADSTLPERQRGDLARRAAEILGEQKGNRYG
jgi:hypothetical protein